MSVLLLHFETVIQDVHSLLFRWFVELPGQHFILKHTNKLYLKSSYSCRRTWSITRCVVRDQIESCSRLMWPFLGWHWKRLKSVFVYDSYELLFTTVHYIDILPLCTYIHGCILTPACYKTFNLYDNKTKTHQRYTYLLKAPTFTTDFATCSCSVSCQE